MSVGVWAQKGPVLTLVDKKIETKSVKHNTPVTAKFRIKNDGDAPLIIFEASATCDCTKATWPKQPILPGKQAEIEVVFDGTKLGKFNKPVYITTNANDKREVIFLKGEVFEK